MLRLLGIVMSIGLADSLNPSTVGPALFLASGRSPRRSVAEFTLGTFAVNLLGGLILTLGPGRAILALVPKPNATTRYILETVAGAAMLIAVPILWRQRGKQRDGERQPEDRPRRRSPLVLGATIAGVELPTAFPYFAVIAAVVGSGLGLTRQLILVAVYNVIFIAPLLAILATLTLAGNSAVTQLARARTAMREHWPVVATVLSLLAGIFVITLGITGLTSAAQGGVGSFSRGLRHLITHPPH